MLINVFLTSHYCFYLCFLWLKAGIASQCVVLLHGGKTCVKPALELLSLTFENFSIPPPCNVWEWFSTDRALDVNIRPNRTQLALRRPCQPLWLLWEMIRRGVLVWVKTTAIILSLKKTNAHIISSWCRPTFHYYIKVVDNHSSWVFSCTHIFPFITLFYSRYS